MTHFEIDTVAISLDRALERFKELILPALHGQPGYQGLVVLRTPEGRGMLVSLWDSEEAARAGVSSGYYEEQVRKFITFYRQPPGREHFEVAYVEMPATARV